MRNALQPSTDSWRLVKWHLPGLVGVDDAHPLHVPRVRPEIRSAVVQARAVVPQREAAVEPAEAARVLRARGDL